MKKLYIVHGWAYGLEKWQTLAKLLKKAGIEVIFLHVPGLTKNSNKVWTIAEYVVWLENELKNVKGSVVLLGHSNGGRIAMNFTLKNPGKVKELILLDSAGIFHNELKIRLKRTVFKFAAKLGKKVSKSALLRKILYKLARESDYHDAPVNMRQTMANMLSSDRDLKPEHLRVHTTIIWGENDTITPISDAYLLHEKIDNSSLVLIHGAKHSPHYTIPEVVASEIEKVFS